MENILSPTNQVQRIILYVLLQTMYCGVERARSVFKEHDRLTSFPSWFNAPTVDGKMAFLGR